MMERKLRIEKERRGLYGWAGNFFKAKEGFYPDFRRPGNDKGRGAGPFQSHGVQYGKEQRVCERKYPGIGIPHAPV